jgi:hypothetical protein
MSAVTDLAGIAQLRRPVRLGRRHADWIFLAFFAVNLGFITYFIDIEQLTIANVHHFQYPLWPPKAIVNMVHSYGQKYDPLLMARPAFWKMTIWIDVLWNGPFYVAAIYAITRGRDWIRVPALVWSGSMSAVVLIILPDPALRLRAAAEPAMAGAADRDHHPDGARASLHRAGPAGADLHRAGPAGAGRDMSRRPFATAYGPWTLVAGGSEGLGAAFADELGRRGLNLVLVARRPEKLAETAAGLRSAHGVDVETVTADLASRDAVEEIAQATAGRPCCSRTGTCRTWSSAGTAGWSWCLPWPGCRKSRAWRPIARRRHS